MPLVYGLTVLPFFDCIANQLNNALHLTIGPLSLLQAINGPLLMCYGIALVWAFLADGASLWWVPLPVPGAIVMIGIACTEELVRTGTLSMASVGPYGQMLYWVFLWAVVAVLCRSRVKSTMILRGLAAGAIATAFSVFLGFALGAKQYYGSDSVLSSAGWFDTAKMITGVLITGGVILIYLGRNGHRVICALLSSFCFTACILTYARAGWVAAGAVMAWLGIWAIVFAGSRRRRSWLVPFFALCLVAGAALPAVIGVDKLMARWSDVGQGEQAGSGRATFWKIAFDEYVEAVPSRQIFGRGYNSMADMLLTDYGMDIRHTHNDMLDMLTVAGACGAVWLLVLIGTLLRQVIRSSFLSMEGAASMAILLTYVLHSQLTGQIWGTDAMSYYTVALACLYNNARARDNTAPEAVLERASLGLTLQEAHS
jgi:hypothetical protein